MLYACTLGANECVACSSNVHLSYTIRSSMYLVMIINLYSFCMFISKLKQEPKSLFLCMGVCVCVGACVVACGYGLGIRFGLKWLEYTLEI